MRKLSRTSTKQELQVRNALEQLLGSLCQSLRMAYL